ncbi:PD-(D/E)XK motif protein [Spiroplasma culicicola]|uniref:Uncharacterized protein n=1 Tax=Spiroplasma culicicola AES-1 TaxID=1276246 RepID=W6A6P7_9MOLU|nr:PD-(D/E)XK motif protein [Spiroplasma culicicola]AHI52763.1 hypothetical protein SCULI_v1c04220 [Spiroplasma culicicola AES-1]
MSINDTDINIIDQKNGYIFFTTTDVKNFYILKPTMYNASLPKSIKPLKKPNFSYYPSVNSITSFQKEDARIRVLPNYKVAIEYNDKKMDGEVLAFEKGINIRVAELIYTTFINTHEIANSMFEIVKEFENIFGLIWKIDKKFQIGLIGELLVMQKNEDYIDILMEGFHGENIADKNFESITDFELKTKKGIKNIEVKTSISNEGLFTLKNNQLNTSINDYFAAVTIEIVKKGGQTLIDLIDWYLELPSLKSELKNMFLDLKESHDSRNLLRFDPRTVKLKFIDIHKLPKIQNTDDRIKNIKFQIDLNHFEDIQLKSIIAS